MIIVQELINKLKLFPNKNAIILVNVNDIYYPISEIIWMSEQKNESGELLQTALILDAKTQRDENE